MYLSIFLLFVSCIPDYAKSDVRNTSKFEVSYYWPARPEDADLNSKKIPMRKKTGELISYVPKDLVKKISLEGSGFIPDGRLLNIACQCPYPNSKFMVVDKVKFPFGKGSRNNPLIPMKSIAMDKSVLPFGSKVYIPAFDGLQVSKNSYHNGCFIVSDVGSAIKKNRIDIFTSKKSSYKMIDKALGYKKYFSIIENHPNCL